ncbi:hypothetical protein [Phenylobacterium sp.]|uniref:hypothetical protein n=1 Tax=Phenylobacterium sp. TaxID=1871053 RepID=UPI0025D72D5A|nr:hypothetical protein [Phenylobacterium sp.]MBX3484373.1 hypothetical protein [Phenylobacterium sp.]MCW5759432.1 hypothetical protein [Phenylobacterium sp.]
MSLASLFGLRPREGRAHDPSRPWAGPADGTPIHGFLDQRGVPWRAPRGELIERFGVTDGAIPIATARPVLPGLVGALTTQAGLPPSLPATEFTGLIRLGGTPVADVRQAADEVSQYLGRGRVEESRAGAECLWRFGAASLSLRSTPDGCEIRIRTA